VDGQTAALEDGSPESRPHPSGFLSLAGGAFTSGLSSHASSLSGSKSEQKTINHAAPDWPVSSSLPPFSKPIKVKSSQIWPNHGRSTQIAPPAKEDYPAQIVSKTLKTLGNSPKQALKNSPEKLQKCMRNPAYLNHVL
jgi:hypothetical protein